MVLLLASPDRLVVDDCQLSLRAEVTCQLGCPHFTSDQAHISLSVLAGFLLLLEARDVVALVPEQVPVVRHQPAAPLYAGVTREGELEGCDDGLEELLAVDQSCLGTGD